MLVLSRISSISIRIHKKCFSTKITKFIQNYRLIWNSLIELGFNMSTLVGHFVSSPREREKRDRRPIRTLIINSETPIMHKQHYLSYMYSCTTASINNIASMGNVLKFGTLYTKLFVPKFCVFYAIVSQMT